MRRKHASIKRIDVVASDYLLVLSGFDHCLKRKILEPLRAHRRWILPTKSAGSWPTNSSSSCTITSAALLICPCFHRQPERLWHSDSIFRRRLNQKRSRTSLRTVARSLKASGTTVTHVSTATSRRLRLHPARSRTCWLRHSIPASP